VIESAIASPIASWKPSFAPFWKRSDCFAYARW
jgi:hypothetical protein